MLERQSVCLRQLACTRATEVSFGRWLGNAKVTTTELNEHASARTGKLVRGRHVLAIQDTTEINYQAHARRVHGLGPVGNNRDVGLFLHPLLVVDAEHGNCLGLGHVHTWLREGAVTHRRRRPIEQKESYRWLETAEHGKRSLREAAEITFIADREGDIYEEWDRVPETGIHLLIRACRDRKLATGERLFAALSAQPVVACYLLAVKARPGQRSAHVARMEIRHRSVVIRRPRNGTDPSGAAEITLSALDVHERAETVVGAEQPIHWRLLTTHTLTNVEEVLRCIDWYCQRWHIEQLFRTLKKQGLDLEGSQVESAEGLLKLAYVATRAAVQTLQLTLAREGNTERPASDVFDPDAVKVLKQIQPRLEGRTARQKNPYPVERLAWAAWLVARLGGWKGYRSEAKPGPITMLRGQQRLATILEGWRLANLCA